MEAFKRAERAEFNVKEKEHEWLQMFKQIYELSKKPKFATQLREKLESLKTSFT